MNLLFRIDKVWYSLKCMMVGVVLLVVGVTQVVFGWIGDAIWIRAVYGLVCLPLVPVFFWQAWRSFRKALFGT
ncbi:hypothetical protein C5Y93_17460 [Blastopirellula marina]|uniref:Uncharacterized protein n=1 Tax=Blastopirellula marina TaxID=124 RepID=A0A2S8GKB1_9BACT|nr:hypothetical protein C5Y93_17460 [Blastopirellula marina]